MLLLAALMGNLWYPSCQAQSVLSSPGRSWFKLSVKSDAVYKVDYNFLRSIGFNPDAQNSARIQLFTSPAQGMVPQPNSVRNNDLVEVSIYLFDGGDGKMQGGDYFLFFGKGPDRYGVDPGTGIAFYENHLYSDENYYFLSVGTTNGLRVSVNADSGGTFPAVDEFDDVGYYESELTNVLRSGRSWYGERFDATLEYTVRFDHSGVIAGKPLKLLTSVMARTFSPASFQFLINNVLVNNQSVPPVLDVPYETFGSEVKATISTDATTVGAAGRTSQDVKVRFTKASSGTSFGYLDYLILQTKRVLALTGHQTVFRSLKSLEQPVTRYAIQQATTNGMVWDVTSLHPSVYQYTTTSGISRFTAPSTELKTFIVVSHQFYPAPVFVATVDAQNLRGIGALDLLVITAPEFESEAQRFADYRRSHSGLNVSVATTLQVYNEFSGGKQDVSALRDFVKYLYDKGTGLKNVLLIGRGSYDYKKYLSFNKNFVPLYQSRNSLSPLKTYGSDDFIAFLEDTEGNWGEDPVEPHTLDIGIGRIPVKKVEEAKDWVDKVIAYEKKTGPWRKRILFAADDGDFNIHQSQADQLAENLNTVHPEVDVRKVYLDAFAQTTSQSGPISKPARKALTQAVNEGVGIINFTGHGSELQWMQERIVDQLSLDEWKPSNRYPFLLTATCEFGRHDDPGLISTAELALFRKNSGTIGMLTTSRPVFSSTNFTLNNAFYQSLFTRNNGLIQNWGAVFRMTKNTSMAGVSNRNFILLGDPSMLPPLGSSSVVIDEVNNLTSGSDTLKALSHVQIRGSIFSNGVMDTQYNGTAQLTLFDTTSTHLTLGDENAPFAYTLYDNALFRGQASVQAGAFELDFILPKAMHPKVDLGKIGAYAQATGQQDALGARIDVKTGGQEAQTGTDASGPGIELFMGDTTFLPGGLVGPTSRIVAILTDENGIDISNYEPTNDIRGVLDDTLTINLNGYYQADVGTYRRGKVDYPIDGLSIGSHLITLHATDTYGNTSSATIPFTVTDSPGILIESWLNYPNPFSESTIFHFKHSRPGEDLEAAVTIFDRMGKVVLYNTYQIGSSTYKVDLPPWDGTSADGNKLSEGLYLMKLSLRSLLDGTKNERLAKVILVN